MKTGVMKIGTKTMIGKRITLCAVLLALFSLGASAQTSNDSLRGQQLPETYDEEAITDYLAQKLPLTDLATHDDYVNAMAEAIEKNIPNEEWRVRYRCDFAISLIQMVGTVENPKAIMERYLATTPPDSLAVRVRNAYDETTTSFGKTYPGEQAPDFTFTDTDGRQLSLSDFLGKTLLIDIWGTWCVPCIEEMPFIEKLQQRYAQREDVHIMSIACDKKADRWKNFLAKHPTSWHHYLITPEGDTVLNDVYHTIGIPRFIIIDKEGKIVTPDAMRPSEEEFTDYFDKITK